MISKEKALEIAKKECKKEKWEFKDVNISDEGDNWFILTNKSYRGGNALIYVSKDTGSIIKKMYNRQ